MKKCIIASLLFLLVSTFEVYINPSSAAAHTSEEFMQQVVELTNQHRAEAGLPPLKLQRNLCDAAGWMAQNMAEQDYVNHTDEDGQQIDERMLNFGYKDFVQAGENIGAGQATPAELVEQWMESDNHRENILNPTYREVGAGYFYQADDQDNVRLAGDTFGPFYHYWAEVFGNRTGVYPLVINGEAARSNSFLVDLYLYGEGWAEEMRLSNDGNTWTEWMAYQNTLTWALADGANGPRTVYMELRQGDTVLRASDSVMLEVGSSDNGDDNTDADTGVDTDVDAGSDTEPVDKAEPALPNHTVYLPMVQYLAPVPLADESDTTAPDESENATPVETCLSSEEATLAESINTYRAANGLSAVPVSISLSQVAQAHVQDLATYHPDTGACNQHSWSEHGIWTPVCYTDDHANAEGMWNKPREITSYDAVGYEIAFLSGGEATAVDALAMWQSRDTHNNVLLQQDMWETHTWQAMGVAIRDNYAVAWFGDMVDVEGEASACR